MEGLGDPDERDGGLGVKSGGDLGFARVAILEAGQLRGAQLGETQSFLEIALGSLLAKLAQFGAVVVGT